jgi:hypothetical protein
MRGLGCCGNRSEGEVLPSPPFRPHDQSSHPRVTSASHALGPKHSAHSIIRMIIAGSSKHTCIVASKPDSISSVVLYSSTLRGSSSSHCRKAVATPDQIPSWTSPINASEFPNDLNQSQSGIDFRLRSLTASHTWLRWTQPMRHCLCRNNAGHVSRH